MPKRRPCNVHLALVGILALALLVPAASTAAGSSPGAAMAGKSKKKCKKGKKCKKKKKKGQTGNGPAAGGPAGNWTGTISSNGTALSFSVSTGATSVDNFAVPLLTVFCAGGEGLATRVFLVPTAPVSGGAFATVLQTTNSGGEVDGSMELSGQLGTDTASGSLRYNRAGCASGPVSWTANRTP